MNHVPIYRVKYNESESDIQNNNLFYKIDQQRQNTFDVLDNFERKKKVLKTILLWILYKFHNSYFVIFVNFVILGFVDCLFKSWLLIKLSIRAQAFSVQGSVHAAPPMGGAADLRVAASAADCHHDFVSIGRLIKSSVQYINKLIN